MGQAGRAVIRWSGCLSLALAAAIGGWTAVRVLAAPDARDLPPMGSPRRVWRGAASCAAMACHNAGGPLGSKGSEYTTWAEVDPHHRAFAVLHTERSATIQRNRQLARCVPAWRDRLCLGCHVDPEVGEKEPAGSGETLLEEGVGCEACHGPAGDWLAEHTSATWRRLGAPEKQRRGMLPTKNVAFRVQLCVRCHVGGPNRDINHELIAAGHPWLHFEAASYDAVLPKHWNPWDDRARAPDFEVRTWALGQAASAQAALRVLAARASDRNKPWPEFADYNCFTCHQALAARGPPVTGRAERGLPEWGMWYYAMLPQALSLGGAEPEVRDALQHLRGEMSARNPRVPARKAVARSADELARLLTRSIEHLAAARYADPEFLRSRFATVVEQAPMLDGHWDRAAPWYLALTALYQAEGDLGCRSCAPEVRQALEEIRTAIRFPQRNGLSYDSPLTEEAAWNERIFESALQTLRRQVAR